MTHPRPSLYEEMTKHSSNLWLLLGDERGAIRVVPIYEDATYRELVIRGYEVVCITFRDGGQYEYRASRAEAEWRADLDLDQRRGAPAMQAYPKPLGTFTPRRRQILSVSDIVAMFGEIAA